MPDIMPLRYFLHAPTPIVFLELASQETALLTSSSSTSTLGEYSKTELTAMIIMVRHLGEFCLDTDLVPIGAHTLSLRLV